VKFLRRASDQTFLSLQVRNFRLYMIGQFISISGTWLQSFALGYLVIVDLHGSAVDLAVTVALPFLPMLLLGPFGGAVVDRSNKRRILYMTQSAAGLLALTMGILVTTHDVSLTAIWTIGTLLGVINLFDNPARQSFVQEMVGKDLLPTAVSLNSAMINMGRIVGPAIGGALLFVGIAACFYVNAVSFLALLTALVLMRSSEITPIRTVARAKGQIREGLRYVWANQELREVLVSVVLVGLLAFNFTVTLPLLALGVLHGTRADYSFITCSMGLGGLVGGLFVAHRSRPTRKLLGVLALCFGILMAAVAIAPTVLVACILIVPMGAASLAFVSTANATLQLNSKEEMRGRVMSLYAMGFLGTTPIGAIVIALVAAASSARVAIGVGAAANLVAFVFLTYAARSRAEVPATVGSPRVA
jgi:MFS family permease